MHYLDRIVADSRDRPTWLAARSPGLGASDAASFSKIESVPLYVRAKIKADLVEFHGNAHTATGNRWEQPALAGAGFEQNTLLFRHSDEHPLFLATPDGIRETGGGLLLAEAKALLVKDLTKFDPETWMPKIDPSKFRQIAWAQYVLGADLTHLVALPYDDRHVPLLMVPRVIPVPRDEALISHLLTIAHPVLAALTAARAYERNLSHV